MKIKLIVLMFFSLIALGCATPPEVKQLSVKQTEYFGEAINAVMAQSQALVTAANKIAGEAYARAEAAEQDSRTRFEAAIVGGGLSATEAAQITKRIRDNAVQLEATRTSLDGNVQTIVSKTAELKAYLEKMKEVHLALDAYIQSEKAGEKVLNDVLKQPSVSSLLNEVSTLTPIIQSHLADIQTLVNGL